MPDQRTHTATGVFVGGRYQLEEPIGRGGAGEVWAATDTVLGRRVAVKMLRDHLRGDATTAERFRREATAAAALAHPSAVTIYDIGDATDEPHLVMELVDGPSLADVLTRGPLEPGTVAALGAQVAGALAAAHERGLVHRDVKPANILLATTGLAKVADFGVAKALDDAAATLTDDGTVVGTAAYLAPEQVAGEPIGPATDVYALGLILWECLTGERAFGSGTVAEVTTRRLASDAPPVAERRPDAPAALADVIAAATRRDPAERIPDGSALADALVPLAPEDATARLAALAASAPPTHDSAATAHLDPPDARDAFPTTRMVALDEAGTTRAMDTPPAGTPPADRTGDATRTMAAAGPVATPAGGPGGSAPPPAPTRHPDDERLPDGPEDPHTDRRDDGGGAARRRHPAWLWIVAAPVVALVVIALLGGPGDDASDTDADAARGRDAPWEVAEATDHDPFGGDGEHPEKTALAHDGDPATDWTTQRYNTADLGGLKDGVGLVLDLGESRAVSRVELELGIPGATLELYALDEPPGGDQDAWGDVVGGLDQAPSSTVVELERAVEARYWLVWFTSLPADGGRHRVTVNEVRFLP